MANVRAFIAVELSGEAKEEIARIAGELKKAGARVKWTSPGTIHLTLKFLGDVPEEGLEKISARLTDLASGLPPFSLSLISVGAFPGWKHPKVVWVGAADEGGKLKELALTVDSAMAEMGFEKERREFSPHITIGRVRGPGNREKLRSVARGLAVAPAVSKISKVILFKSDLTPEGAVHTALFEHELRAAEK